MEVAGVQRVLRVGGLGEAGGGIAEVDADDAVLGLAEGAAMLPLDAGGLVTLLGEAGLVDDADGAGVGVSAGDALLSAVSHPLVVPIRQTQELLKGAWGHAGGVGDGLDALAVEAAELAADVGVQVGRGAVVGEAGSEAAEQLGERGADREDHISIHVRDSSGVIAAGSLADAAGSVRRVLAL